MIGILIVTHGMFSKELLKSAELIVGKQESVKALTLNHDDSVDALGEDVLKEVINLEKGEGVVVFTDLFGGSPSNATAKHLRNLNFECITGVNLPMLIEGLTSRNNLKIDELVKVCEESGKTGIKNLKSILLKK